MERRSYDDLMTSIDEKKWWEWKVFIRYQTELEQNVTKQGKMKKVIDKKKIAWRFYGKKAGTGSLTISDYIFLL